MMLTEIERQINLIEDVRELRAVQGFVKDRRRALGNKVKWKLKVGDNVQITNGGKVEYGEIIKINRTRAVVSIDDMRWTVPFSMITKMGDSDE